ncbi:Gfo/Idh/MocA family protein [Propionibacteriaceae bacterium G1746]|uniref:Gfo/Idh/MocA family protein n=1 Tax=Aestuariimicrobium sp. G57 TaxID=3418485 RepID=UPI003C1E66AE
MNISLATVGTSSIVHRFAAAAAPVEGLTLVGAYSRDPGRAAATADELGMAWSTSNWDQLLADDRCDALYIATPNLIHAEQTAAALRAGKHVLLEKPATPTAPEWQSLIDLAHDHGVVLLEEMRPAHDPGTAEIARLLPSLGAIRRVSLDYTQRSARYDKVLAGEYTAIFDPGMAAGSLRDLGVYAVSQLVQLFGEPHDVMAAEVELTTGADGLGVVLATYADGFVADVSHSKITRTARGSEIQGERGSLLVDHIADPQLLKLTRLDGSVERIEVVKADDNLTHMVEFFVACVNGTASPEADQERTAATLRVIDRISEVRRRV